MPLFKNTPTISIAEVRKKIDEEFQAFIEGKGKKRLREFTESEVADLLAEFDQ
jgi:hypothetical protein